VKFYIVQFYYFDSTGAYQLLKLDNNRLFKMNYTPFYMLIYRKSLNFRAF